MNCVDINITLYDDEDETLCSASADLFIIDDDRCESNLITSRIVRTHLAYVREVRPSSDAPCECGSKVAIAPPKR
jgi:hypothetical protein